MASSLFVTLLRGGVHLILANPPWRQLQERAQKIQGDKKHVEGMLSRSHCAVQYNTGHKLAGSKPYVRTQSGDKWFGGILLVMELRSKLGEK